LLGRNGAAKSTCLSAIAQLIGISTGSIRYADDLHTGIASQKDVLWEELTCTQVSFKDSRYEIVHAT
jgi:ATP-binding cassette subfamily A (ABC1) protein 3